MKQKQKYMTIDEQMNNACFNSILRTLKRNVNSITSFLMNCFRRASEKFSQHDQTCWNINKCKVNNFCNNNNNNETEKKKRKKEEKENE